MSRFLLVCLGGAVGSGLRYATAIWAAALFGASFPYGTLIVNVAGSFAVGLVMELAAATASMSSDVRLMLTAGLFGGFTTYSSFNYDTTAYLRQGSWGLALANVGATVAGCMIAGMAGLIAARWLVMR